jgi:GDSL-like lipase/acylhydrolase family protein
MAAACLGPQWARGQSDGKAGSPQNQGIVFVGSSIFRFWARLTEHMAPLPVLNRAIAGTVTQDMLDGFNEFVARYHPRIVVYYCGSNDVSYGERAEAIIERTQHFVQILHEKLPNTFFYYTAIQKAPEKRARWNVVDAVNREMERFSHQTANAGFLDLNPVLFDAQGRVRDELFLPDRLHFRPDSTAYAEFASIIKPVLTKDWDRGVGIPKN